MADDKALNFRDEARANAVELFSGPGEVRSHARELDWSKSPLGPTTGWSPEEVDAWMTASPEEALKLQRPFRTARSGLSLAASRKIRLGRRRDRCSVRKRSLTRPLLPLLTARTFSFDLDLH